MFYQLFFFSQVSGTRLKPSYYCKPRTIVCDAYFQKNAMNIFFLMFFRVSIMNAKIFNSYGGDVFQRPYLLLTGRLHFISCISFWYNFLSFITVRFTVTFHCLWWTCSYLPYISSVLLQICYSSSDLHSPTHLPNLSMIYKNISICTHLHMYILISNL